MFQWLTEYRPEAFNLKGEYVDEKQNWLGLGILLFTIFLGASPIFTIMFVIFEHFDCVRFIIDDIFPDVEYRELSTTLLLILISTVFVAPSVIEIIRSIIFLMDIGLIVLNFNIGIWRCILHKMRSTQDFIDHYILFQLVFRYFEFIIGHFLFIVITVTYWGTVAAVWVCINGIDKIEPVMYIFLVVGTAIAVATCAITMPMTAYLKIIVKGTIAKHLVLSKFHYIEVKTRVAMARWKQMISLRMIRIMYGSFFHLEENFVIVYFSALTERIVDSVLMIELPE